MRRSRLIVDVRPLRHLPEFRKLWLGYLVSSLGSELTVVAIPYQAYRLTHSSLQVGLISLAQLVPLLVGAFGGGVIADALDRRRLLVATASALALTSGGLALNASLAHPKLWALYVLSVIAAGVSGVDSPTRSALVIDLLPSEWVIQANALWQLLGQLGAVFGPAVAGLLIGRFHLGPVYGIDAVTFLVAILTALLLRPPPRVPTGRLAPRELVSGLAYLRSHAVLQMSFLIDLDAMIFGMPQALFPALGVNRFHGGATTVGLLYAAPGAGALLGALLSGWVARVSRQGRAVIVAVVAWGVFIIAFGISNVLALSLVFLGLAGAADVVSAVFRNTILQFEAPPSLQGRLQAVKYAVVSGGPSLGNFEAGAVAAGFGAPVSVVSGGVACLLGLGVLCRLYRGFSAWRAPHVLPNDEAEQADATEDV